MPHLSPLNWILMFISMTTMVMTMNSNFWWKQKPKFSLTTNKLQEQMIYWNW